MTVTGADYTVAQLKVVNDATTGAITLSDKAVALTGDADSSAIYRYDATNGEANVTASELTLVGTVDAVTADADIVFA